MVEARTGDQGVLGGVMGGRLKGLKGTWMEQTWTKAEVRPEYPFEVGPEGPQWYLRPGLWMGVYLALASFLRFVVLW